MSVPRLFHCTVAGLVIATGLSFLFGASGLFNYRDLLGYEAHVSDGIADLQDRHLRLRQRAAVLRDNPEALRLLAREAGYFRPGETVVEVGPTRIDPTAAAGARSTSGFADVTPLLQRTPPLPREPFNALALGLFLGIGSFAALGALRAFRSRHASHQPDGPSPRAVPAAGGAVVDSTPSPAAPPPAPRVSPKAAGSDNPAHGKRAIPAEPAAGEPAAEPAAEPVERRKRARRRRDVTVYRL